MNKSSTLLKIHLRCAFTSRGFWLSLAISTTLVIWQIISAYTPIVTSGPYPSSVFARWIGGEFHTLAGQLFYILLPLICALPFQSRYFLDKRDGYIKSLSLYASKRDLFFAYYIANYIVSFSVAVIPLLLNLLSSAMLYPSLKPQPLLSFLPSNQNALMVDLFYSNPWAYFLLYIGMIGLFMAALSCVGLAFSPCMKNVFFVISSPFIGYFIMIFALEEFDLVSYCPLYFLQPTQIDFATWPLYLIYLLAMLIVSVILFRKQVNECEIL